MYCVAAHRLACVACAVTCFAIAGCVNSIRGAIPAQCLSEELLGPSRDDLASIDFTCLGQFSPPTHVIGPDDLLGVYIQGIIGHDQEVQIETEFPPDSEAHAPASWYEKSDPPENISIRSPAVGTPIAVMEDGTITLPFAPNIPVAGLTVSEAAKTIREIYTTKLQLLVSGHDVIKLSVVKPRSIQVVVLREDSINKWPFFKQKSSTLACKRGSGWAVNLPVYQNDVLHALTESGGLPGSDAGDEVWVLHRSSSDQLELEAENEDSLRKVSTIGSNEARTRIVKIPLKVFPGQSPNFIPNDVILETGDVVFVPSRDREHFFVGGVLNGLQVYLPRDYELDVVEAIAMASGQPVGPPGNPLFKFQQPGSLLPPTRVLVLRKVPGGEQVTIHVDLKKALHDRKERIPIRSGDVILLQYTPGQIADNLLANMFGFQVGINRGYFTGATTPGNKFQTGQ